MRTPLTLALVAVTLGCSEYDFSGQPPSVGPTAPETSAPEPTAPDPSTAGTTHTVGTLPELACDDSFNASMPWHRSEIWTAADPPEDAAGLPWFDPDFDDSAWAELGGLPDEDWNSADHDLFYRASFWLEDVVGRTDIEFVGNDGVWLYVNGGYVGHWGGEWREGGCINEPVNCGVNTEAPPVDVTDFLVPGENTLAVMLTNGPTGFYLEINARCVEE